MLRHYFCGLLSKPITMSRYFLIFLFLLTGFGLTSAQINLPGVFKENVQTFRVGDTVYFTGAQEDMHTKRLYYFLESNGDRVAANKIQLLIDDVGFWELQQFYYTSQKITELGWQTEKRKELNKMVLNFIAALEAEGQIYRDKYAEDFLQQLIQKIHYPKINKGSDYFLSVKIVNSENKYLYAFDNGAILITTQLLAESKNYDELVVLFSRTIAHILLNSNMDNLQESSSSELQKLGAIYSESDKEQKRLIADNFINYTNRKTPGSLESDAGQYIASIAGIISYTAWQEYYNQQYSQALVHINRLEENEIANSTDLLLKAKCYMEISNTPKSNKIVYEMLLLATTFQDEYLPEIYSEMGLVLLRLKEYEKAKKAYLKYQELISCTQETDKKTWVRKMIKACNYYIGEETAVNDSSNAILNSTNFPDTVEGDTSTVNIPAGIPEMADE